MTKRKRRGEYIKMINEVKNIYVGNVCLNGTTVLMRSSRPGYPSEDVTKDQVDEFINEIVDCEVYNIICLLSEEESEQFYSDLGGGLVEYYRENSLNVTHISVNDYSVPALTEDEENQVIEAFKKYMENAEAPVLIHCSAGVDRTGQAIEAIKKKAFEYYFVDLNDDMELEEANIHIYTQAIIKELTFAQSDLLNELIETVQADESLLDKIALCNNDEIQSLTESCKGLNGECFEFGLVDYEAIGKWLLSNR